MRIIFLILAFVSFSASAKVYECYRQGPQLEGKLHELSFDSEAHGVNYYGLTTSGSYFGGFSGYRYLPRTAEVKFGVEGTMYYLSVSSSGVSLTHLNEVDYYNCTEGIASIFN